MYISLFILIFSDLSLIGYLARRPIKKHWHWVWMVACRLFQHLFTITDRKITLAAISGIGGFSAVIPVSRIMAYVKTPDVDVAVGIDLSDTSDLVSVIGILALVFVYGLYVMVMQRR